MYKDSKWARSIIALQEDDGKWGWFHSLSQFYPSLITTEQALRRLERLGYTMEDECIQKVVSYMDDCLTGKKTIPDRREKNHDWDVFTSLMLSAWIRRFTSDNANANEIAKRWADIITCAFAGGSYHHGAYIDAYRDTWGIRPTGGRLVDFTSFYQISLLTDCLDDQTENHLVHYVLNKEDGIYYVYERKLAGLPCCFASREASRYLGAIELLMQYRSAKAQLTFVKDWLIHNQNENGAWDLGKNANDRIYFPLSDDWRKKGAREADCTVRISAILKALEA